MKNKLTLIFTVPYLLVVLITSVYAQSPNQSCEAGGEMWVCGKQQQLKAHADFDENCSDWDYEPCTILRTIVDVCSPNMRETRVFEAGDKDCPLNNVEFEK